MNIDLEKSSGLIKKIKDNVTKVFLGKDDVTEKVIKAMLSGGHILLEDIPGVGKTLLAKAVARSVSGEYRRIQFTADLLPTDVTGVTVYQQKDGSFVFRPGPVFCNVLLADEINRATPRTQSSLLEAMEELQVTVEGQLHKLNEPFFVIATQNPIELEGTYPLPFSQMDRFMVRLKIGYPDFTNEKRILAEQRVLDPIDTLTSVIEIEELLKLQDTVRNLKVSDPVSEYIVKIARRSRDIESAEYGVSPRCCLDLMRYSQAAALCAGRDFVTPDDVKSSAEAVMGHRIIVRKGSRLATSSETEAVDSIVESVEVPL
ncbi:MAG TPA: hypothetical protein DCZ94_15390 [Lentisphaeria bacterium]|nr:MAG: hypothetical protein A2X48_17220 [Lentisphaerae bacterium GWF2_49_21]HBC88335.1 hypothetical protein [Lentisphaeria bacterium]